MDAVEASGSSGGDEPRSGAVASASDEEDLLLWRAYKETGNPAMREKLILKYAPFVKFVAGRMAINLPSNVDYDDLVSYGIFGLIDAIDKFDPERAIKFKTYAKTRIRGGILDELRMLDWTPRSIRQRAKQLERAYATLEGQLGREATDEEVANYLGVAAKDLHKLFDEARQSMLLSLDEGDPDADGGSGSRMDTLEDDTELAPDAQTEDQELRTLLAQHIANLNERERLVITLYYFERLTSKEIGQILGVSDSRVSQIHTKAVLKLRGRMGELREAMQPD